MKRQRAETDTIQFHILPLDTKWEKKTYNLDGIK